ncbi:hydroxylysine kinase-like [Anneissia japonica]|uniref:hydroxylysine kinase-like n=1 Tax=Anneissia japonica TaxID=1529436 RepID=UPI0014259A13|nr:hydroxylysine kinase-like [Anneissia japonica]XP_033107406.1 hydroxylysine kinase-like [Anneissia japonica]
MAADMSSGTDLQEMVGSIPFTTRDDAKKIMKSTYNMNAVIIKKLDSYDDLNFYIKTDDNYDNQDEFVLKIFNKVLSQNTGVFEAQTELMIRLQEAGIPAPVPLKDINGKLCSLEHFKKVTEDGVTKEADYMIRLLTYIPGQMLVTAKQIPLDIFYNVGKTLAQMHNAWKDYEHPSLNRESYDWNLLSALKTREFLHLPKEEWQQNVSQSVLDRFESEVFPHHEKLNRGIIHGDFNELNVLVKQSADGSVNSEPQWNLSGVLDFGDCMFCPYIFDVGISLAYMMLTDIEDEATVCKWYLSGYESVIKLPDSEKNMIVTLIATRLVQSLLLGLQCYSINPSNTYVLSTQEKGWKALRKVWGMSVEDIQKAECPKY